MNTGAILKHERHLRYLLWLELVLLACIVFFYGFTLFPDFYRKNLFNLYFNPPNIAYYTDENQQLQGFRLQTLSEPIIKREALLHWATLAATSINTFTSSNYQQQLQSALSTFFTEDGAKSLMHAFNTKGIIDKIVAKKLSVTSVVQNTPILLDTGIIFNRRIWKVQIPMLITYESLSDIEVDKQLITLIITAVPTALNPLGIAIDRYQAQKR